MYCFKRTDKLSDEASVFEWITQLKIEAWSKIKVLSVFFSFVPHIFGDSEGRSETSDVLSYQTL